MKALYRAHDSFSMWFYVHLNDQQRRIPAPIQLYRRTHMRVQNSSHKKTLFFSSYEPHMYASIQLHCLDSHTKKSPFSSTHPHALLPVRWGPSKLRCHSARDRTEWEWSLFEVLFFFSTCCRAAACAGCLPFAKACARFQGCICLVLYFWIGLARGGREILYDVLFFLVPFHLARFSLAAWLIGELDFADKNFLLFYG